MCNFLTKFFRKKSKTLELDEDKRETEVQVTNDIKPIEIIHEPLLTKLKSFKKHTLNEGDIIFHGSREFSLNTDYVNRSLLGDRKWLSEDIEYAVNYAFYYPTPEQGRPLLWVCKVKRDLECLKGSQKSLTNYSPWSGEFAYKFPNNFSKYAKEIQGDKSSYGLVDLLKNGKFQEILISPHSEAFEIVDVLVLTDDNIEARKEALYFLENG